MKLILVWDEITPEIRTSVFGKKNKLILLSKTLHLQVPVTLHKHLQNLKNGGLELENSHQGGREENLPKILFKKGQNHSLPSWVYGILGKKILPPLPQ